MNAYFYLIIFFLWHFEKGIMLWDNVFVVLWYNGIVPCLITEGSSAEYKDGLKKMSYDDAEGEILCAVLEKASIGISKAGRKICESV